MRTLIKQAKLINKDSAHHGKVQDILIVDGIISEIGKINADSDEVIEGKNLHVSPGFFDMRCSSADPGHESMDTLQSLSDAASAGGFTELLIMPNTVPVIQNKESLSYFRNFSEKHLVNLIPAGAVTKNCEGKDFTEMWDMLNAGAAAFTDGSNAIWNADIFLKTLQYLFPKKALLINKPMEPTLALFGQMHEGISSTRLGMKGIPDAAEEIMIQRDLKLLEYSGLNYELPLLHFSTVSSSKSVELIRKAKKNGLPVSCDIAAHQLAFTDDDLSGFDTNLKVNPPFRSKNDVKALQKGLADGTIDAIVSDHHALDEEQKNLEFDLAEFGIISLQTTFSTAIGFTGLELETIVEKMTNTPRTLLRRKKIKLENGEKANLTIFDPAAVWQVEKASIKSLSFNSPFLGKTLKGKILATINKGKTQRFE